MLPRQDPEYIPALVRELRNLPHETEWVEFKGNNDDPNSMGEYISALANGATLSGKQSAYMVWGIEDATHRIEGTKFSPGSKRVGNQPLELWLHQKLDPKVDLQFHEVELDERRVVLLKIEAARYAPVAFAGERFIRVGSVKKKLREVHQKEPALWQALNQLNFEDGIAAERVSGADVLKKLNFPAYFRLLDLPLPEGRVALLNALVEDGMIKPCIAGGWNITSLGAVLLANDLADFSRLGRKAMRVIQYKGSGRVETYWEQLIDTGYAAGFEEVIKQIATLVPSNEVVGQALRRTVPMFPDIAIRELVANALIHQDFSVTGAGPMVEIFDDRMEITNPGEPLMDTNHFVETPPKSRNEGLASMMRRFGICEERGSGIDKVITHVELFQLPAPLFESPSGFTRATLFAYKPLADMDKAERVRACYQHSCLRYVTKLPMSNTSIRERFGISKRNTAQASRILKDAVDEGAIVIRNPEVGTRNRTYLPFWAATS